MTDPSDWTEWLLSQGLSPPVELRAVKGGRNNKGFEVKTGDRQYFLKEYRDEKRLMTEFEFLSLLDGEWTARPVARDLRLRLGLYEFIAGSPPDTVGTEDVEQARRFFLSLQSVDHRNLSLASDACASLEEHWQAVLGRVSAVEERIIEPYRTVWAQYWRPLLDTVAGMKRPPDVLPEELMVSPSDFGFHNALRGADGALTFIDLEYAGLDEPCKIVCDFFCQPSVPVPLEDLSPFLQLLTPRCRSRLPWMWHVTVIKWACIVLKQVLHKENFSKAVVSEEEQLAKLRHLQGRAEDIGIFLEGLENRLS